MITHFSISPTEKAVSWENNGQPVTLAFDHKITAHHIAYLDTVLVLPELWKAGERVFTIYHADGAVKARPGLPRLRHEVGGIYSIWYNQGQRQQTVVLLTNEFSPYDTACDFDLETYEFSNFHPTK